MKIKKNDTLQLSFFDLLERIEIDNEKRKQEIEEAKNHIKIFKEQNKFFKGKRIKGKDTRKFEAILRNAEKK